MLGIREIIGCTLILWALAFGVYFGASKLEMPYLNLINILLAVVWGWVFWFFRDPDRKMPQDEKAFICPADGVVADITQLGEESVLKRQGVQIGVFMNVFSVHVNRMPFDAEIIEVNHKPGQFLDVRKPESYEVNESTTLKLSVEYNGEKYPVLVRQIAGLVARRIVTTVKPGDSLKKGERFGMIKFGSRVELVLPTELAGEIPVKIGQNVKAGADILARIS